MVVACQQLPGPQAGRIGNATGREVGVGGVGLVPNAAQSWIGVRDVIPSTYRRVAGLSGRSTEARVGARELRDRALEATA